MGVASGIIGGLGLLGGIAGGRDQAQAQNRAAELAAQPQPYNETSTRSPWDPAIPYLERGLGEATSLFENQQANRAPPPMFQPPGGGGGGGYGGGAAGGAYRGASGDLREIADLMRQRAEGGSPLLDAATQYAVGQLGDPGGGMPGTHPLIQQTYDRAANYSNPALEGFLDRGAQGGFDPSQPYMQEFLGRMMSGGSPVEGGAYSSHGGGPFFEEGPSTYFGGPPPPAPGEEGYLGSGSRPGAALWNYVSPNQHVPQEVVEATFENGQRVGEAGVSYPEGQTRFRHGGRYSNDLVEGELEALLSGNYLEESNPYLEEMIGNITREAQEAYERSVAGINAQSQGAGQFGSGMYRDMMTRANEEFNEGLQGAITGVYSQNYGQERDRMMQALGLAQQREEMILADRANREAIAAQRAASMSGVTAAGLGGIRSQREAQAQRDLERYMFEQDLAFRREGLGFQREGLTLDAIGQMSNQSLAGQGLLAQGIGMGLQQDQFGLGLMGNLAQSASDQGFQDRNLRSQTQLGILGMIPGLEESGYYGLNQAFGAQGQISQMDSAAAAQRAQAAQRAAAAQQADAWRRAQLNFENQQRQWEWSQQQPGQDMDDWLRRITAIGSMGGTTTTEGVRPGTYQPQVNENLAGLQGGLGMGLGLLGAFGGFGGG